MALIRLLHGRLVWYPPGSTGEPLPLDEEGVAERLRALLARRRAAPCFAVPGEAVRLARLEIRDAERRHIGKLLPFAMEEEIAGDIEELHFAFRSLEATELSVAVCAREAMEQWQSLLAQWPGITRWVPEPLLLPWREGEWCLVLEDERAVVRTGEAEGFSIERDMLATLLAAAGGEEPAAVIVYGADQAADTALIPAALQPRVQWRQGNFCSALMLRDGTGTPLNLRQGEYAPRLPLGRWWRQWRAVAALAAVAFLLQLVATYIDYLGLERENLALRGAVEASYRRAYPRGAVVDAEKQLGRQLDALRGSGQTGGFISLVSRVGEAVTARPGTRIASINYNDRSGEMRMNIEARDYEAVEQVRAAIDNRGLTAVLESSSAQGDQVRARLRVGDRS